MDLTSILVGILTIILSSLGAFLAGKAALNRVDSQNSNDQANAVSLYEQAAARRQLENDQLRLQITDVTERLKKVESAIVGPFRIVLEFTTSPELKITKAEIEIIPVMGENKPQHSGKKEKKEDG